MNRLEADSIHLFGLAQHRRIVLSADLVEQLLGILCRPADLDQGLIEQFQSCLQFGHEGRFHAVPREFLHVLDAGGPGQDLQLGMEMPDSLQGQEGVQGVGEGQHHQAGPVQGRRFQQDLRGGIARDHGVARLAGSPGPIRILLQHQDPRSFFAQGGGQEAPDPAVADHDQVACQGFAGVLE